MSRTCPEELGGDCTFFMDRVDELSRMPIQELATLVIEKYPASLEQFRDGIAEYIATAEDDAHHLGDDE